MNYFDDYGDSRRKIPYDDVPITRNERTGRSYNNSSSRHSGGGVGRLPLVIISLVLFVNMVLSVVCIYLIKTKNIRTINNYELNVNSSSAVSSATAISAFMSSVQITTNSSAGAGVIYKIDGNDVYFVTCEHVITGSGTAKLKHPSFASDIVATVIGCSESSDVAVLKYTSSDLEWELGGCKPITWFNSAYISWGEKSFAIGNSLGYELGITDGVVSVLNEKMSTSSTINGRFIRFSAEINPGNSGGGLFNADGQFIGLVDAKIHSATSSDERLGKFTVLGMSYAVPSTIVKGVADRIIAGETEPDKIKLNINFTNSHMTIEYVTYNGELRQIETYEVIISDTSGSFAGILSGGEIVESFIYKDYDGVSHEIPMYNEYSFDDYAYLVKKNSTITFKLSNGSTINVVADMSVK